MYGCVYSMFKKFNDNVDEFLYYSSEPHFSYCFFKKETWSTIIAIKILNLKTKGNIILKLILFLFSTYISLGMMRLAS